MNFHEKTKRDPPNKKRLQKEGNVTECFKDGRHGSPDFKVTIVFFHPQRQEATTGNCLEAILLLSSLHAKVASHPYRGSRTPSDIDAGRNLNTMHSMHPCNNATMQTFEAICTWACMATYLCNMRTCSSLQHHLMIILSASS